jgi:hypothetical protein
VAVHGRAGVGRGCVARALRAAGLRVAAGPCDVDVFVVAEVLKPEDLAAIAASRGPTLVVLNKADLSGFGPGGPLAAARERGACYRALTGVPIVPMVAHLAVAEPDDELIAALRMLADEPGDLGSTDGFIAGRHRLPVEVRKRLLEELDLFGIAHGVLAVRGRPGADAATLGAVLRRHSCIDGVVDALAVLLAEARYRRIRDAATALEILAVTAGTRLAAKLAAFSSRDDIVIARMAAAVDVVESAGVAVDRGDDAQALLCRAVRWQRYAHGPVNHVHRACGADIARGSLRLSRQAGPGT